MLQASGRVLGGGHPDGDHVGVVVVGHEVEPVAEDGAAGPQRGQPAEAHAVVAHPHGAHVQRHGSSEVVLLNCHTGTFNHQA